MDEIMLTVKYVEFLALQLSVFAVIGAVLIAGLRQVVQDKVRESRRRDRIMPQTA